MVSVKFSFFLTVVAVFQCGADETASLERFLWLSIFGGSFPCWLHLPPRVVLDLGRLGTATSTGMTYPVLMDDYRLLFPEWWIQ
ncbi:MAG: hypothetical protein CMJ81_09860 [Planctomycetaceae bacterium]|nr:hypothetical protein [Planctomycetaceae bacterium]MBP61649.1 hypothetical protein [Planctomycetaceae bacterium]